VCTPAAVAVGSSPSAPPCCAALRRTRAAEGWRTQQIIGTATYSRLPVPSSRIPLSRTGEGCQLSARTNAAWVVRSSGASGCTPELHAVSSRVRMLRVASCRLHPATCIMLRVASCRLHPATCIMLRVASCRLHPATCIMLHVASCRLHPATCIMLRVASCRLHPATCIMLRVACTPVALRSRALTGWSAKAQARSRAQWRPRGCPSAAAWIAEVRASVRVRRPIA
jgi:hypothetical protein